MFLLASSILYLHEILSHWLQWQTRNGDTCEGIWWFGPWISFYIHYPFFLDDSTFHASTYYKQHDHTTIKLFHNNQSFVPFAKSVNITKIIIWVSAFDYYVHFVIVIELYCTRTICSIIVNFMVFVFSSQILSMQILSFLFVQEQLSSIICYFL